MICKKCKEYFPVSIKIDGKRHILNKRSFCFKCSPFKSRNTKDLTKILRTDEYKRCSKCKQMLTMDNFYCDKAKKDGLCWYCKKCHNKSTTLKHKQFKILCLEYIGNKCIICFENQPCCLEFHHRNPTEKEFNICIDFRNLSRLNEKVKKELDKCITLCSNCHRKFHAGIIKIGHSSSALDHSAYKAE